VAKKYKAKKRTATLHVVSKSSIWIFSISVLLAKILWLSSLPGKGVLGADGENYLEGLSGLLRDGLFSSQGKLLYWPAGYPILMWPFAEISTQHFAFTVGIFQSILFSISVGYFVIELSKTNLSKFSFPILVLLNLNPTLALNSPAIGYEIPCASLFIISISALLRHRRLHVDNQKVFSRYTILASISLALSSFMQPRMLLLAIVILVPFAWMSFKGKSLVYFLAFTIGIIAIAPVSLVARNKVANDTIAVSTNLGVTMNIGAGPDSTGGYTNQATGVPCKQTSENVSKRDQQLVRCVVNWYMENPAKTVRLFWNKLIFHWSPWFGPLANGTMARSPWLDYHPLSDVVSTPTGEKLINGLVGKTASWLWEIFSVMLIVVGFVALNRLGGTARLLSWILFLPTLFNTLSSMATIGDNRFRLPTMTLSLQLQLMGLVFILGKSYFKTLSDRD
jgi:hypothetical protein